MRKTSTSQWPSCEDTLFQVRFAALDLRSLKLVGSSFRQDKQLSLPVRYSQVTRKDRAAGDSPLASSEEWKAFSFPEVTLETTSSLTCSNLGYSHCH